MEYLSCFRHTDLLHTEEPLWRYRPGGYHPVHLGDAFQNGRYTVHHKLGFGSSSTVWLVDDNENEQWVALKIKTAVSSTLSPEIRNLERLGQQSDFVVQLLDEFSLSGPNGTHQCLVFELLGPSLHWVLEDYHKTDDTLDTETIIRLAEQILHAVESIHDAGMAHGEICAANIAFTSSRLSRLTGGEMFQVTGRPQWEEVVRSDGQPLDKGLPKYIVEACKWDEWSDEYEESLRVLDLEHAFIQGEKPKPFSQRGPLRVPESIFTKSLDYRVDLWTAGCVIYALIFQSNPFIFTGSDADLVRSMVSFVGCLPGEWKQEWEQMKTESGDVIEETEVPPGSELKRRFNEGGHDPELACLMPLIQGLIKFQPKNRLTAAEALELLYNQIDDVVLSGYTERFGTSKI
ncbi:kinase-like protein [Aspergillus egyptiacus]|nr:kinase-like protein [Aspergillus egyptiacus]